MATSCAYYGDWPVVAIQHPRMGVIHPTDTFDWGVNMRRLSSSIVLGITFLPTGASAQTPLERGTYLMQSIVACGNCHTPKGPGGEVPGMELAGGFTVTDDAFVAVASNITPDPETGIGRWTDAQIITAIREGKRPDGSIIGPPMPIGFYRGMSDSDVKAIVAYLRNVKPVKNAVAKSKYNIPLPASYGPPVTSVPDVAKSDKRRYGEYLGTALGHCMECHTPMVNGVADVANRVGAGGNKFQGPFGVAVSRNLTPDKAHGLGNWTDAQIKTAITTATRPDGEKLKPPMAYPYYARISADDMDMLIVYLRSLKPLQGP
jgi:mono/diheme cytochrome c family protein